MRMNNPAPTSKDPSYFSREYKKLFGAPPQRDIARLRSNLELGGSPVRV